MYRRWPQQSEFVFYLHTKNFLLSMDFGVVRLNKLHLLTVSVVAKTFIDLESYSIHNIYDKSFQSLQVDRTFVENVNSLRKCLIEIYFYEMKLKSVRRLMRKFLNFA